MKAINFALDQVFEQTNQTVKCWPHLSLFDNKVVMAASEITLFVLKIADAREQKTIHLI